MHPTTFPVGPPTVEPLPEKQTVTEGNKMKLICKFQSFSSSTHVVWWHDNGRPLRPNFRLRIKNKKYVISEEKFIPQSKILFISAYTISTERLVVEAAVLTFFRRKSVLRLRDIHPGDSGNYTCQVGNVAGKVQTSTIVSVRYSAPKVAPSKCPIDSFCMHGGLCLFYELLGELVCK